jgi:hypothetical protein
VTSAARGTSSAVPVLPPRNANFVPDYNGIGQDDMTNVLSATAPGVVAIRSNGKTIEAGSSAEAGQALSDRGRSGNF